MARSLLYLLATALLASATSASSSDKRVLALLDNLAIKETHSIYFKSLTDSGFEITYKVDDDPFIVLKKYSAFLYDHLVKVSTKILTVGLFKKNCAVVTLLV